MTLTPYCSADDVESLWSAWGVEMRVDDEDLTDGDAYLSDMIEKATADVNFYVIQQYSPASLATSTWVRWCTAIFAAVDVARRRGNAIPDSMVAEWQRYLELLKAVAAGSAAIPGDDGVLAPRFDTLPAVSNMRIDSRFGAPIRRVPNQSTNGPQEETRKSYDMPARLPFYW